MKKVVIATANPGKAREFTKMLAPYQIEVQTLADYPEIGEIKETGKTFAENAALKAETVAKQLNMLVIADDSGLVVDALNGAPGIYSARYAGEPKSDERNNQKLLVNLKNVPLSKRTAHFHCTLAVAYPNQKSQFFTGDCPGLIIDEPSGENGFGYDPLFYLPDYQTTMANLSPDEKNKISHRARALDKLAKNINEILMQMD